jgi:site-specific DNA-cytosine methylase
LFAKRRLIDNDEMAQATLERNHPHADTLREDVNILIERVEKKERGYEGLLIAHHGHASPPCQGSSAANTTGSEEKKRKENEKTLLFPKKMVLGGWSTGSFENVTGMLRKKNISYLQGVMHELLFHDIQVRVGGMYLFEESFVCLRVLLTPLPFLYPYNSSVLDSSHFGVPQSRKRLVLLASKSGFVLPEFPKPTHGPGRGLLPLVTAKDAIGFLEDIPPRDYRAEPRRVRVRDTTRGSDVFVDHHTLNEDEGYDSGDELVADKPAHTIICKRPVRHYNGKRNCSNLERAVLQTFPPHWKFSGRHGDVKRLIGNAVPPLMAKLIGKCIMECYEDGDYLQQSSEEQSACIPPSTSTDNASSCLFPLDSPDQPPSNNSSRNRPPRVSLSPKSLPTFPNDHSRIA